MAGGRKTPSPPPPAARWYGDLFGWLFLGIMVVSLLAQYR